MQRTILRRSGLCLAAVAVIGVAWLALPAGVTAQVVPDLEVYLAEVSDSNPVEGGRFTLRVTVGNFGHAVSAATTLRYYLSTDATISSADTQVGTNAVGAVEAHHTSQESIDVTAPATAGTYYYGACADGVAGEFDTTNNCSNEVMRVDVSEPATGGGGGGGAGDGGGGDDEPSSCTLVAPYWSGPTGGFTVRPAPDRTSVSVICGGTTTEHMAENGLVTRFLRSTCGTGLRLTGAAPGGWYWQHGERNAAAAPFVCSEALGGPSAVVPGGVTVDVTDNGTWFRHDTERLVGIVPHVVGNECSEYVTPYWQGDGGVVIRPAEGRQVRVKVHCGRTYSTMTPAPGGDGLVVELVRKSYCTDAEGNPKQGRLTVTGADPGGWYWISGERNAAVGSLMCADLLGGPAAVDPDGVTSQATDDGTYFRHDTDKLIGVVPHVASDGDDN